ncbi:MAG: hypothetical protein KH138_12615, partial [Firmicutes bacterium]|nr:hypothetical protein [Bacillota bacterium]
MGRTPSGAGKPHPVGEYPTGKGGWGCLIKRQPLSLSKKSSPAGLFRVYMIKWFWVMKDAGTKE